MMSRYMQVRLFLMIVIAGLFIALSVSADATITGDDPPMEGDWIINNPTVVTDEVIYIDGNITVNAKLDIWGSTVVINVSKPCDYNISVMASGHLNAQDTIFASNHTIAGYGFRVWGQLDLLHCVVTGTEDGLRILTKLPVTITSTVIDDFHTGGMYLENADGTTIRDVTIQSDRYETSIDVSRKIMEQEAAYPQLTFYYMIDTAPLHIQGGSPSIEGLTISVFGTTHISGAIDYYCSKQCTVKNYYYSPVVLVEGDEFQDLIDFTVIDSAMDFSVVYYVNFHILPPNLRQYIYDYFSMVPIIVHNPRVLAFEDIFFENVRLGTMSVQVHLSGLHGMVNAYQYHEGTLGIMTYTDETYEDSEVNSLDISLIDSTFIRSGALYIHLAGDGTDEDLTKFSLNLVVDSITVRENSFKSLVILNSMSWEDELYFWAEIEVTDSSFTLNGADVMSFGLSAGGGGPNIAGDVNTGGSTAAGFMNIYDNITIENCYFEGNYEACIRITSGGGGGTSADGTSVTKEGGGPFDGNVYEWIYIRDNVFDEHRATYNGPLNFVGVTGAHNGTETMIIEHNTFTNYDPGISSPVLITINGKDVIEFTNNTFTNNKGGNVMRLTSNGGDDDRAQPASILISDNDFTGNRFWQTYEANFGMFIVSVGGNLEVTNNKISDDSSKLFLNIYDVPKFAGFSNIHIHHNEFVDSPDMAGVLYLWSYDVENNLLNLIFEDNVVRDCGWASLMEFYDQPVLDLQDYDPTIVFRNNTVTNVLGGVIRIYGNIRIEDNTFTNCHGYVLDFQYLSTYIPIIEGNTFQNCHDLIYMGGKAKNLGGLPMTLENIEVDCTGNAFRFNNMQATIFNIDISYHSDPAVIAENSLVSIVGGDVKVGSGRIIGPGSIIRYRLFEVFATWADAACMDTGIPASDVPVVLLDVEGRISVTRSTDENGSLGLLRIPVWSLRSMFLKVLSPYRLIIGTPGIANSMNVAFDQDYVGNEALYVQVVDDQLPVIRVTSPITGQYIRADYLTVNGFVVELGSGIEDVILSIDGRDPVVVSLDTMGRFAHDLVDVEEGQTNITLTVKDKASNFNNTMISVILDWTPPSINVIEPDSDLIIRGSCVLLVIVFEPGCDLFLNGVSREYNELQLLSPNSRIYWYLFEGENIILIELIDAAGNIATETIKVTRDSISPYLSILTPRDGSLTNDQDTLVTGETEPGVDAWLVVLYDGEEVQNLILEPDDEGMFSLSVHLDEGTSVIVLHASDAALNSVEVQSQVTLDITPPEVAITSPDDGLLSNSGIINVMGTADDDCLVYLNGMPVENIIVGHIYCTLMLGEGETIIELVGEDLAGNKGVSRITVTTDTTRPVIDLVKPVVDRIRTSNPVFEIAGLIQGEFQTLTVMGEEVTVSDGAFSEMITLNSEGLNKIIIVVTDAVGNFDKKVLLVDVSWTEPQIVVEFMTDGDPSESTSGTVLIVGTVDKINELRVFQNSTSGNRVQSYLVGSGDFTVALDLEEGQNTLVIQAIDSYGNINEIASHTIDYTPFTESEEEEGKIDLLDMGIVILAFGIALFVMVFMASRVYRRNHT